MKKVSDIFITSKDLRKIIVERIRRNGISIFKLCVEAGVRPNSFLEWCKTKTGTFVGLSIKHTEIIQIMSVLGIEYHITFILKNDENIDYSKVLDYKKTRIKQKYEQSIDNKFNKFVERMKMLDDEENYLK